MIRAVTALSASRASSASAASAAPPLLLATQGSGGFNPFEFAPGAAFWTWVIFLLSLPVMWKFVFGPIAKALAQRDQQVVDAAKAAEEARQKAEQAVAQAQKEREEARAEGKRMVLEATARAERQAVEAQRAAKAEAERLLQKAREDIEVEKRRALRDIRREVVDLAIASAGRILEREVDDRAHRDMVDRFVAGVETKGVESRGVETKGTKGVEPRSN